MSEKASPPPIPRTHALKERERTAAMFLAQGKTIRDTARLLGVSEKTIWNYRQKPGVQQLIRLTQEEFADMGGGLAMSVVPEAVAVLQKILNDPETRASDRIQAARTLMSGSSAYQERKLLERQIRDLEVALGAGDPLDNAQPIEIDVEVNE